MYGSIEVYAALVKALVAAFGHAGSLVKQVPEMDAAILDVTAATLDKQARLAKGGGNVFAFRLVQ